jgi:hypothetical protein
MPWPVASSSLDSGRMVRPLPKSQRPLITIGRDPKSDVQIDLPIVSWNHAVITEENGKYILEDRNSSNGTFLGDLSNRIQRVVLTTLRRGLTSALTRSPPRRLLNLETKVEIGEASFQTVAFQHDSMEAGRDPNCEIPLPDFPMVSWRHARFSPHAVGDSGRGSGFAQRHLRQRRRASAARCWPRPARRSAWAASASS